MEQLTLFCRYENCNFLSDKYSEYLKHLEAHVQEVPETEGKLSNITYDQQNNCLSLPYLYVGLQSKNNDNCLLINEF